MGYGERESVRRVRAALAERGVSPEFVELEATARSARDAAAALGCRVEQIVKSLVFRGADTGSPVLVLASGPNRVSERRISSLSRRPTPPSCGKKRASPSAAYRL